MSKAAQFNKSVDISGNLDISGNINIDGNVVVDGSFSLHGFDIPDPTGLSNKVLTISGDDGYIWNDAVVGGDDVINNNGQSFYQIITEPPGKFTPEGGVNNFNETFSTIEISWNFDDIVPNDSNNRYLNIPGDLYERVLPSITTIYFDISSSANTNVFATKSISVTSSHDYTTNTNSATGTVTQGINTNMNYTLNYNKLTLQTNIMDSNSYTINVWGQNNSFHSTTNKLNYTTLQFKSSGKPTTPVLVDESSAISSNDIEFTIDASVSDIDINNDNTVLSSTDFIFIKYIDLSYTWIDSTRSSTISTTHSGVVTSSELSFGNNTATSNYDGNGNQVVLINNVDFSDSFHFGSQYTQQISMLNYLNTTYSDYSPSVTTDFTPIPTASSINTANPFNANLTTANGSSNNVLGKGTIYMYNLQNLNSNARITPGITGVRSVEISHPTKTIADTNYYGKYIDNSENLISINCLLYHNDTFDSSLQQVNYHGWNNDEESFVNNATVTPFINIDSTDMYAGATQTGFRRVAKFQTALSSLKIADLYSAGLISPFDPNSVNGYKIEYNMTRADGYSFTGANRTTNQYFYIDDFSNYNNPVATTWSIDTTVKTIVWIMGIPSVSTIDISMSRTHNNIHSQYKYFQSDNKIAEINSIKMTHNNNSNVINTDIKTGTTTYSKVTSYSQLNSTGNGYDGSYNETLNYGTYTSTTAGATSNTITGLQIISTTSNLYTDASDTYTFSLPTSHYRDILSLGTSSSNNYTSIFYKNSENRIYQIQSISNLNSNMLAIHNGISAYTTHTNEIESYSIPFINGHFTLDSDFSYPDICNNFEWDGTLDSYSYTNSVYLDKDTFYDTMGSSNAGGYKWIVYKVDESSSSVEYVPSASNTKGTAGINLSYILNNLFGSTVENSFYNSLSNSSYNNDILVNIVGTNQSGTHFWGRINHESPGFNTSNKWYSANNITSVKSLATLLSSEASGALPGTSLQNDIRGNISSGHPAKSNFTTSINGHYPIAIYIDSDSIQDHYFYFSLR